MVVPDKFGYPLFTGIEQSVLKLTPTNLGVTYVTQLEKL
ncbi:MAG: hypothetical protein ACI9UN_004175 [Granulosicoccus sp.]|jgi:hypothetical protein